MSDIALATRAICEIDDVARLVAGYRPTDETQDVLVFLINAESRDAHRVSGREFVALSDNTTRVFDITPGVVRAREIRIGDCATVTTVKILDANQTTELETVASTDRVLLPRLRDTWEPITSIAFPPSTAVPATLACGGLVQVTGTWGFPAVPDDLRAAVAKMVLVRYLADITNGGTSLAEALNEQGFNPGAAYASARDTIRGYSRPPFA